MISNVPCSNKNVHENKSFSTVYKYYLLLQNICKANVIFHITINLTGKKVMFKNISQKYDQRNTTVFFSGKIKLNQKLRHSFPLPKAYSICVVYFNQPEHYNSDLPSSKLTWETGKHTSRMLGANLWLLVWEVVARFYLRV